MVSDSKLLFLFSTLVFDAFESSEGVEISSQIPYVGLQPVPQCLEEVPQVPSLPQHSPNGHVPFPLPQAPLFDILTCPLIQTFVPILSSLQSISIKNKILFFFSE